MKLPFIALLVLVLAGSVVPAETFSVHETFGEDFDAKRFLTPIPNKYTQIRDGVMWTHGDTGSPYPPMVYLALDGKDLTISFRYRHLGADGWLWLLVDGDDGFGSVDHMHRVKLLRDSIVLEVDAHTKDPQHPLRQKQHQADPVSGAFRTNELLPAEKVDLSANVWHEVKVVFAGESAVTSVDGKTWSRTLVRPNFNATKRKLLWMQKGGEEGIEIDDVHVVPTGEETPKKQLPLPGDVFTVQGRTAFLIPAGTPADAVAKPWVWYAPTLPNLPGEAEQWMFQRFHEAGIAVAGIDVGESYGSPAGRALYSALYDAMTGPQSYSREPVLLARSRGGLMTLSWGAENADKVGAFAGIYPVCNLASYPGLAKAAPAYATTPTELETKLVEHNPIDRLDALAKAGVPLFAIHGDMDKLVPLDANSGLVKSRYQSLGGSMELIVPPGQGHSMWEGFFHSEDLVKFVIRHAQP